MHLGNTTTNMYKNYKFLQLSGFTIEWIKKIMFLYLVVYFICRVESAHWALKKLLQNSLGDLCSVWKAINNMITLQHTKIKASFETSIHVVGHVFKVTLYKRLLGIVLNQIAAEFELYIMLAKTFLVMDG